MCARALHARGQRHAAGKAGSALQRPSVWPLNNGVLSVLASVR
jgi:hypothetical protein